MNYNQIILGLLFLFILACNRPSDNNNELSEGEEQAEELPEDRSMEVMEEEKSLYQQEVEKFGNDNNFPARIKYSSVKELRIYNIPEFKRILKDYQSYFLTEFISKPRIEEDDEIVYYITFDKQGRQIDIEQIKRLNDHSRASEEFITERDIRVRYEFNLSTKDADGNIQFSEEPYISYQHFSIDEKGEISRIFCEVIDGKFINVIESYAVMPEKYIAIEEEGMQIDKIVSKLNLKNGYLEANNARIKMAVFQMQNGYNISLLQKTKSDMCCDYYNFYALRISNNELCEVQEITTKVIPKIDSSAFFQNATDSDVLKDYLHLNYQIPEFGTELKIVPEFCSCEMEELGVDSLPEMKSITLKWNKESGKFEF